MLYENLTREQATTNTTAPEKTSKISSTSDRSVPRNLGIIEIVADDFGLLALVGDSSMSFGDGS